uniref:Sugar phosphate transporter domain-containing protein n=1 Tax=Globodera rostochiensis TaxID=31243 RepID=A0A914HPW6_GLORO
MTLCLPVLLLYAFVSGKNVQQEQRNALKVLHTAQGHYGILHSLLKPLLFLALWTSINYAYAQAASTALVWILGWILLRERFSALKFVTVLLAMAGVVVVAMDNKFATNNLGICLAILSTVIAAFYKVLFKLCVGNASLGQVSLFMTVLGVLNLVLNTLVAVVLLQLGFDHIEWDHVPWSPLIGSALLRLVFNFLLNFGIALLDPLVISIGMLFGMPLSACIDFLFRALPISAFFLVGSLLITISFVLIAFPIELAIRKMFCSAATADSKMSAAESIEEESSSEKECEETPFHH